MVTARLGRSVESELQSVVLPGSIRKSLPLQYLRGFAALSVVVFHASHYAMVWRHDDRFLSIFGAQFGFFGVALFFVASGALMAMLATQTDSARFMLHRVVRIFPIYLVVVCALILARSLLLGGADPDPWALALIPGGPHSYSLGTEWTLPFEITFYIVVFVVIVAGLGRWAHIIAALWIGAILLANLQSPTLQGSPQFPTLVEIPVSTYTIGFAAGMLIPRLVELKRILTGSAIVCVIAAVASQLNSIRWDWWALVVCASLVTASLTPRAIAYRPIALLAKLGDWSYAIYLCHVPIIVAIVRFAPRDWPSVPLWVLSIVAAILVSSIVGMLDLKLYARAKRWVDGASAGTRRSLAAAFILLYVSAGIVWVLRAS